MSERVELLREELSDVFGPGFGSVVEASGGLTGFAEQRRPMVPRGGPSAKGRVPGKGFDKPKGKRPGKSKGKKLDMATATPEQIKARADRTAASKKVREAEKKAEKKGKGARAAFKGRVTKSQKEQERARKMSDPDEIEKMAKATAAKPEVAAAEKKKKAQAGRAIGAFRGVVSKREKEHKAKEAEKAKAKASSGGRARAAASGGGGGKSDGGGGGGRKEHNPFKHSPNLGKGPGTPPGHPRVRGKVHHDQKRCWSCNCAGGAYEPNGCKCKSLCKSNGPKYGYPPGSVKTVRIKPGYRSDYNKHYRAWRTKKGGDITNRLVKGK